MLARSTRSKLAQIILMDGAASRISRKLNWSQKKHFDVDEYLIYVKEGEIVVLLRRPICRFAVDMVLE